MNYYSTRITTDKISQDMAKELFEKISATNRIKDFRFVENNVIAYETRGYPNISDILNKYNIVDNEIFIEDEFERAYRLMEENNAE